jgi:hypothetical protein
MNKPTDKTTHGGKDVHGDTPKNPQMPEKAKPAKLDDGDLDKVAGGIGGLGAPIPVKR